MITLNDYVKKLEAYNKKYFGEATSFSRVHPEMEAAINTLWIPNHTGNRTAKFNLNHEIFEDTKHSIKGIEAYFGSNWNCGTGYCIIQIPLHWGEKELEELGKRVADKLNKPDGYPTYRAIKADERMPLIVETIQEMQTA